MLHINLGGEYGFKSISQKLVSNRALWFVVSDILFLFIYNAVFRGGAMRSSGRIQKKNGKRELI